MITDNESNFVYVSALLKNQFPKTFTTLSEILTKHLIGFAELPFTNDIWCRDYMPFQISEKRFVQFRYEPSYFTKEDDQNKTKPFQAYARLGIAPESPNIILDGGNIIKSKNRIIMTDFILKDNPGIQTDRLAVLMGVSDIIIVPHEPYDITGHADGMIRFVDENTVLLNDYSMHSKSFRQKMRVALKRANFGAIELPYVPSNIKNNEGMYSAKGNYANFLQVKNLIIVPKYGIPEDTAALQIIKKAFNTSKVIGIDCCKLAHRGGVLNCVTWNIKN